jgi:hypothetical protein
MSDLSALPHIGDQHLHLRIVSGSIKQKLLAEYKFVLARIVGPGSNLLWAIVPCITNRPISFKAERASGGQQA